MTILTAFYWTMFIIGCAGALAGMVFLLALLDEKTGKNYGMVLLTVIVFFGVWAVIYYAGVNE